MSHSNTVMNHVADTAFWVAYYRMMESQRADALFTDSFSEILVADKGADVANIMKQVSRYAYWTIIIRTLIIDKLLIKYINNGVTTIINLGAGLDTRPYRLSLPSTLRWVELDFPDIIDLKNERLLNESTHCHLERIGIDMRNIEALNSVLSNINQASKSTLVLTEGVTPYLSESEAATLAQTLHQYDSIKVWINEYYAKEVYPRFQNPKFQNRLGAAPFKFFPEDWFSFFKNHGWRKKELHYLYDEGQKQGRPFPLPWFIKLIRPFLNKDDILKQTRVSAYSVLEKISTNGST